MKRLFVMAFGLCVLLFAAHTSSAQVADDRLSYRNGHLWAGDARLERSALAGILSANQYSDYVSGRRLFQSGVILTSVGGALAVGNGAWFAYELIRDSRTPVSEYEYGDVNLGMIISCFNMCVGAAVLVAGVPCLCVGINRLKQTASAYDSAYSPQLAFGATSDGIGLRLEF